jgi:hypothetical protein
VDAILSQPRVDFAVGLGGPDSGDETAAPFTPGLGGAVLIGEEFDIVRR